MSTKKELNELAIHHIGIVTKNIDSFLMNYPISNHSNIIEDQNQKALITFVNAGAGSLIELVQPLSQESQTFLFSWWGMNILTWFFILFLFVSSSTPD